MPKPTPDERRRLDEIRAALVELEAKAKPLKQERATILSKLRMRKMRAAKLAKKKT